MNILVFNDNLEGGGAEQYLQAMVDELENRGHNLLRIVFSKKKFTDSGIVSLDYNTGLVQRAFRRYTFDISAYRRIRSAINSFEPDIVHIHNNFNSPLTILLGLRDLPVIKTVHDAGFVSISNATQFRESYGTSSLMPLTERCFRPILNRVRSHIIDSFITPSDWVKTEMDDMGYTDVEVVPNFVEDICPQYNGDFILFVGRLSSAKGLDVLINALAYLDEAPPTKIAGQGPFSEELRRLVDAQDLCNEVTILGYVSRKRLRRLYRNAKVVVVPSRWPETFGLVAAESMAAGTPVIGSNQGALPEIISRGKNGCLFTSGNAKELSERVSQLWRNDTTQMGKAARNTFETEYQIGQHINKIEDIYSDAYKR